MNPTIKRLLAYCAQYPRWLIQAGICLLLATGAEVAGPLLIKLFIDDYLAPRNIVLPTIALIAAGYLGLQVLSAAGFYLQSLRFNRIAQAVVQTLPVVPENLHWRALRHALVASSDHWDRPIRLDPLLQRQLGDRARRDTAARRD